MSDHDKIIKKFCLNSEGVWKPIGEWDYNNVNNIKIHLYRYLNISKLFIKTKGNRSNFES